MIGRMVGPYRILSKLGQGGMGEVYLAEDTALGRKVAVKFLSAGVAASAEALERFRREARAAAALEHPGIVAVHQVGEFEGRPYIVMSLVEGHTLESMLRPGPMPTAQVLSVARQVADALAAAHRAGVIHRDIKPGNIVIDASGRARILDFGLAKREGGGALTADHGTLGTAQYMSPEQVRGEPADARSDLFSLGAVIYEMLAGRPPFRGEHREAVFYSILNDDPAPPLRPGDPDAVMLAEVAMQALAKDPDERFPSADLMLRAMSAPGGGQRTSAPRGSRWMWPVVAGVIALLVYLLWRSGGDGEHTPQEAAQSDRLIGSLTTSQLTFQEGIEEWPAWSPDGTRLAYVAELDGFRKVFVRVLGTSEAGQVTSGAQDDIQPAWSPDSKRIAFVRANLPAGRLSPSDVLGFYYGAATSSWSTWSRVPPRR